MQVDCCRSNTEVAVTVVGMLPIGVVSFRKGALTLQEDIARFTPGFWMRRIVKPSAARRE